MKKKGQDDPPVGVRGRQRLKAEQRARSPLPTRCHGDKKTSLETRQWALEAATSRTTLVASRPTPALMLCSARQLETGHWKCMWSSYNLRVNWNVICGCSYKLVWPIQAALWQSYSPSSWKGWIPCCQQSGRNLLLKPSSCRIWISAKGQYTDSLTFNKTLQGFFSDCHKKPQCP